MNKKIKNFIIDSTYPIWLWGLIYLIITQSLHIWTFEMYLQWFGMLVLLSPLSGLAGRVLNVWRRKLNYVYKGYS